MLTKLVIRNFKKLEFAEIPLGQNVVLIGPNNSGKTSALQALTLWNAGLREWNSRRSGESKAKKRIGVTLNRKSLTHTPVTESKMLWHNLKVTSNLRNYGKQDTKFVNIQITVEGQNGDQHWSCGFEFQHGNSESIFCRPLQTEDDGNAYALPTGALEANIALLAPMSGMAAEEPEVQPGRISVLLGEGRTAEVLRNLCYQVIKRSENDWSQIVKEMHRTFGIKLSVPVQDVARGTVKLEYEHDGIRLDLSSAGRGQQQTLLLLSHLYANPRSVLLLDEPDAHLEILRQRQLYQLITEVAQRLGSQVVAASHSEVLLNEAADRDVVVAFVGAPHRIDDRGSQVLKSLRDIGFDQYFQAEQTGFVLYLEGSTDLYILRKFAQILKHPAFELLDKPFVHYVANQPKKAVEHFYALKEAKPDLKAFALFDNLGRDIDQVGFPMFQWKQKEIENYFTTPSVLLRYAAGFEPDDLVGLAIKGKNVEAMKNAIGSVERAMNELDEDPWSNEIKSSDRVLPAIMRKFHDAANIRDRLDKTDYHLLADHMNPDEFHPEIAELLDALYHEASLAKPRS